MYQYGSQHMCMLPALLPSSADAIKSDSSSLYSSTTEMRTVYSNSFSSRYLNTYNHKYTYT